MYVLGFRLVRRPFSCCLMRRHQFLLRARTCTSPSPCPGLSMVRLQQGVASEPVCFFSCASSQFSCLAISHSLIDKHSPGGLAESASSHLIPSHWPTTSTPQTGLLFGRFAERSPLKGNNPNAPVAQGSTEATPTLLPSRKGSIGSTKNSGDDFAVTPVLHRR